MGAKPLNDLTVASDPAIQMPVNLRPDQAVAWSVLAEGGSQAKAARACGRSANTIAKWLKIWRSFYGPTLFTRRGSPITSADTDKTIRGDAQLNVETGIDWNTLRKREARNLGITASQVRNRLLELLPEIGTERVDRGIDGLSEPVVIKGPDPRVIQNFAVGIAKMLETAELLDGRPTIRSESASNNKNSNVDLTSLETAAGEGEFVQAQAAVEEIWVRFQKNQAANGVKPKKKADEQPSLTEGDKELQDDIEKLLDKVEKQSNEAEIVEVLEG